MKKKRSLISILILLIIVSCNNENNLEENLNSSFIYPKNNETLYNNIETNILVETSENIQKVDFFINGELIGTKISKPFNYKWIPKNFNPENHVLSCIAYSENKEIRTDINITFELKLGDSFKGGKIFYLENSGKSGLIASTSNLVSEGNNEKFIWGTHEITGATSLSDGKSNTEKMIQSNSNASSLFENGYDFNGYNDWYIPSKDELTILKENQDFVGGFSSDSNESRYWSSTELSIDKSFALNFRALMGTSVTKGTYAYRIRPIRKF